MGKASPIKTIDNPLEFIHNILYRKFPDIPPNELLSIAWIALIDASKKSPINKSFEQYAEKAIINDITDYLRKERKWEKMRTITNDIDEEFTSDIELNPLACCA